MALSAGSDQVTAAEHGRHPLHHLDGEILLAYAAGSLGEGASLVVATHLAMCPACRAAVAAAEAVGGTLLEDMQPEPLSSDAMASALARLNAAVESTVHVKTHHDGSFVGGVLLPQPLWDYVAASTKGLKWGWVSPGVRFAALLTDDTGVKVGLMRTAPGAAVTPHGHRGDELTLVLSGGYRDGPASFRRGDVQTAGDDLVHQPTTDADGECVSLVMVDGAVKPTRLIARIFRHFTAF